MTPTLLPHLLLFLCFLDHIFVSLHICKLCSLHVISLLSTPRILALSAGDRHDEKGGIVCCDGYNSAKSSWDSCAPW